MKLHHFMLAAALALGSAAPASAQTAADMVRVEVRVDGKLDTQKIANSPAKTKVQTTALQIILGGKARSPETRIVHWYILGKDQVSDAVQVVAAGQQTLLTKAATTSNTPLHIVTTRTDTLITMTKYPSSGIKYIGYVVRVKDGSTIVGRASTGQNAEDAVR